MSEYELALAELDAVSVPTAAPVEVLTTGAQVEAPAYALPQLALPAPSRHGITVRVGQTWAQRSSSSLFVLERRPPFEVDAWACAEAYVAACLEIETLKRRLRGVPTPITRALSARFGEPEFLSRWCYRSRDWQPLRLLCHDPGDCVARCIKLHHATVATDVALADLVDRDLGWPMAAPGETLQLWLDRPADLWLVWTEQWPSSHF